MEQNHHRRSIRLKGYDYSRAGAYFITICTHNRIRLFDDMIDRAPAVGASGGSPLNELNIGGDMCGVDRGDRRSPVRVGDIVREEWVKSAQIRAEIELDEFVIMPDHFHGIVIIHDYTAVGANGCSPLCELNMGGDKGDMGDRRSPLRRGAGKKSIGAMIAGFKSAVTARINTLRNTPGAKVWHRNYYEHIIRNEDELNRIRQYIINNPLGMAVGASGRSPLDELNIGDYGGGEDRGDRRSPVRGVAGIMGNEGILKLPKTAFFCSRKAASGAVLRCYDWAIEQREAGNCVMSGFQSPLEKDVLHYLLAGTQPIIMALARGLKKKWEPEIETAIKEGRMLVITPFDESIRRITEETSAIRNEMMISLADKIVAGYLRSGGLLERQMSGIPEEKLRRLWG